MTINGAGSSNSDNGALIINGGVGIAENLNVNGNTEITNNFRCKWYC